MSFQHVASLLRLSRTMRQIFSGGLCLVVVKPRSAKSEGGWTDPRASARSDPRRCRHICTCSVCPPSLESRPLLSSKKAKVQVRGINPDISWKIHLCELLPVPFRPLNSEPVRWNGLRLHHHTSFHFSRLLTVVPNARDEQVFNCQCPSLSTDGFWTPCGQKWGNR